MTSLYQTKVKLRQIPFVLFWFAVLIFIYFLIPSHWKFAQALLLMCWWSALAFGIRYFEPKKEAESTTLPVSQVSTYPFNQELYQKAIEHNLERRTIFIRLWLIGLPIALVGVYFKMHHFRTAGFLITIGLFLTSFLSKNLY